MPSLPHRDHFKIGFSKLSPNLQQELFYLSLYEPSSWEEEILFDYPSEPEIKKSILNILKRDEFGKLSNFFHHSSPTEQESEINSFFYSGDAINHIFKVLLGDYFTCYIESEGYNFDVQLYEKGIPRICIGIKRFMTGGNVYDEFEKHVGKILKYEGENDYLFLLFYPLGENEGYERMKKVTIGYQYLLEDFFKLKYDYEFDFYCRVFAVPRELENKSMLKDVKEACLSLLE